MQVAKTSDITYYLSDDHTEPTGIDWNSPVDGSTLDITTGYSLLGTGVTEISDSPNAQTSEKAYINQTSMTTTIIGYNYTFDGSSDMVVDDTAVMSMYNVAYKNHTGEKAQRNLLVIDAYKDIGTVDGEEVFTARLFRVSVGINTISGTAPEEKTFDFSLSGVKDAVFGEFDLTTKTFTVKNSLKD